MFVAALHPATMMNTSMVLERGVRPAIAEVDARQAGLAFVQKIAAYAELEEPRLRAAVGQRYHPGVIREQTKRELVDVIGAVVAQRPVRVEVNVLGAAVGVLRKRHGPARHGTGQLLGLVRRERWRGHHSVQGHSYSTALANP